MFPGMEQLKLPTASLVEEGLLPGLFHIIDLVQVVITLDFSWTGATGNAHIRTIPEVVAFSVVKKLDHAVPVTTNLLV